MPIAARPSQQAASSKVAVIAAMAARQFVFLISSLLVEGNGPR